MKFTCWRVFENKRNNFVHGVVFVSVVMVTVSGGMKWGPLRSVRERLYPWTGLIGGEHPGCRRPYPWAHCSRRSCVSGKRLHSGISLQTDHNSPAASPVETSKRRLERVFLYTWSKSYINHRHIKIIILFKGTREYCLHIHIQYTHKLYIYIYKIYTL